MEDYIRPVALPPHFLQEKNTHPIIKGVASKNTSRILRGPRAGGLGGISLKKSTDKRMTIEDFLEGHQKGKTGLTERNSIQDRKQ